MHGQPSNPVATVAGAISSTSEICSKESPAKKRNSTTRLWRGSILAEMVERLIEGEDINILSAGHHRRFLEGELADTAPAFRCAMAAGIIDKNLAHELGGNGKEMSAALPLRTAHPTRRRYASCTSAALCKVLVWPFVPQLEMGPAAQFLVDQGSRASERAAVTPPPYLQQLRDLTWRLVLHRGSPGMRNVLGRVA